MNDINENDIPYAFRIQKPKPPIRPQRMPIQSFDVLEEMGFKIDRSKIIPAPTKEDKLRGRLSSMATILNHEIEGYMEDFCHDVDTLRTDYSDLVNKEELRELKKTTRRVWREIARMHTTFSKIYDNNCG